MEDVRLIIILIFKKHIVFLIRRLAKEMTGFLLFPLY